MTSTEWITKKLNELKIKYSNLTFSYVIDSFDNCTSVWIGPRSLYESSEFLVEEHNIYQEFFKLYPYELLFFTPKND